MMTYNSRNRQNMITSRTDTDKVFDTYIVYFRRSGKKRAILVKNRQEAVEAQKTIKGQRRKFLGFRPAKVTVD